MYDHIFSEFHNFTPSTDMAVALIFVRTSFLINGFVLRAEFGGVYFIHNC